MYKPYSPEWNRYRYLKEALDTYLNEYVDNEVILTDILTILNERSEKAYNEFTRLNELESMLESK
jgi:hypothetical protein